MSSPPSLLSFNNNPHFVDLVSSIRHTFLLSIFRADTTGHNDFTHKKLEYPSLTSKHILKGITIMLLLTRVTNRLVEFPHILDLADCLLLAVLTSPIIAGVFCKPLSKI